jgi:hypothetical protein
MSEIRRLSSLRLASTGTAPLSRPKIVVINSHGNCPSEVDDIQKLPVDVVTACKLGLPHFRAVFKPETETKELAPHITLSFKEMLKHQPGHRSLSEQALEAITRMSTLGITHSDPEIHRVNTSMRDIELFCPGPAMAEGVYAIYTDDNTILDVSQFFGLKMNNDRVGFQRKASTCTGPISEETVRALEKEYNELNDQKPTLFNKQPHERQTLALAIEHYNSIVDMVHGLSTVSRIFPERTLLSTVLNTGIASGIINPDTDCVVVFACRRVKTKSPMPKSKSNKIVMKIKKRKTRHLKLKKHKQNRTKQLKSAPDLLIANTRSSHQAMAGV